MSEKVRIVARSAPGRGVCCTDVEIIGPDGEPMSGVMKAEWSADTRESFGTRLTLHLDCWADADIEAESPRYVLDLGAFDASEIPMPEGLRHAEVESLRAEIARAVAEAYEHGRMEAHREDVRTKTNG